LRTSTQTDIERERPSGSVLNCSYRREEDEKSIIDSTSVKCLFSMTHRGQGESVVPPYTRGSVSVSLCLFSTPSLPGVVLDTPGSRVIENQCSYRD